MLVPFPLRRSTLVRSALALACTLAIAPAAHAQYNVAQGATVTLLGTFGVLRPGSPWAPAPPPAAGSTIVDGTFLPEGTTWTNGTVWWDAAVAGSYDNAIVVDFGSAQNITALSIQGDDNDFYHLDYRVGAAGPWIPIGEFPPAGSYGMVTRPTFPAVFTASQIRLSGIGGDQYYAISEFQAFTATPEPATVGLLATGLAGIALVARRRRTR